MNHAQQKPACYRCQFFKIRPTSVQSESPGSGECRRQSPSYEMGDSLSYGWRIWPAVFSQDWCAEFKQVTW